MYQYNCLPLGLFIVGQKQANRVSKLISSCSSRITNLLVEYINHFYFLMMLILRLTYLKFLSVIPVDHVLSTLLILPAQNIAPIACD